MIVVDRAVLPPYHCIGCMTSVGPFVDLLRDDEDNPNRVDRVYLCGKCSLHLARQIAPRLGYDIVANATLQEYRDEINRLADDVAEAQTNAGLAFAARDALIASLAASPTNEPTVLEKRGPGRPPGSKNRPKDEVPA